MKVKERLNLAIYVPELGENYNAIWKEKDKPQIGDIIIVSNPLYSEISYYAEILNINKTTEEPRARDFQAYRKEHI